MVYLFYLSLFLFMIDVSLCLEKFVVMTSCGSSIADQGFNQMAYEALVDAKDSGLDIDFRFEGCTKPEDFVKFDVDHVIMLGFEASTSYTKFASAMPDVKFTSIDDYPEGLSDNDNMQAALFAEEDGAFVVGALAGLQTKTKNVGGIFGIPFPVLKRFRNGFIRGVTHTCPECKVHTQFLWSFSNLTLGAELAKYQVESLNVDILFAAAGGSGAGGILQATQMGSFVIGVDSDQFFTVFNGTKEGTTDEPAIIGGDLVISSMIKRVDTAVTRIVKDHLEGKFSSRNVIQFDYSNGGIGLAPCHLSCSKLNIDAWKRAVEIENRISTNLLSTGVDSTTGTLLLDTFFQENLPGNSWTRVQSFGTFPPEIQGMAGGEVMVFGDPVFFFFGGIPDGAREPTEDLYEFNINSMSWGKITSENLLLGPGADGTTLPPKRTSASFTPLLGGEEEKPLLVLFGGFSSQQRLDDVWLFSAPSFASVNPRWYSLSKGPTGRDGHAGTSSSSSKSKEIYIFGGTSNTDVLLNDIWKLSVDLTDEANPRAEWVELCKSQDCQANRPSPRRGHSLTMYDDGHLYLHGGTNGEKALLKDMWKFNVETEVWTQLGDAPIQRSRHTATVVKIKPPSEERQDAIAIIGGDISQGLIEKDVKSIMYFLLKSNTWQKIRTYTPDSACSTLIVDTESSATLGVARGYIPRHSHQSFKIPALNDDSNEKVATFGGVAISTSKVVLDLEVFHPSENDVVEDKMYPGAYKYFALSLFGFNALLAVFFFSWTIRHRKHSVVRASQVHFLAMIALGMIISSSSIIPLSWDDADDELDLARTGDYEPANMACMATIWIYTLGFVLTFAPLFAKMWRVHKIFNSKKLRRINITNWHLMGIIVSLLVCDWGIVLAWQLIDPLKYYRIIVATDEFGNPTESAGRCRSDGSDPFLISIFTVHFLVLVYGNYLCYSGRNVPTTFSEGKYVSIAMVSNLQVLAIATPVAIIVSDEPVARLFVLSGVIFLEGCVMGCLIYVPKILAVRGGKVATFSSSANQQTENKQNFVAAASENKNTTGPTFTQTHKAYQTSEIGVAGLGMTKQEFFSSFVEDEPDKNHTNDTVSSV